MSVIVLYICISSLTCSFLSPGNPQVIVSSYVLQSHTMAGGLLGLRTGHLQVLSQVENRHFLFQLTTSAQGDELRSQLLASCQRCNHRACEASLTAQLDSGGELPVPRGVPVRKVQRLLTLPHALPSVCSSQVCFLHPEIAHQANLSHKEGLGPLLQLVGQSYRTEPLSWRI